MQTLTRFSVHWKIVVLQKCFWVRKRHAFETPLAMLRGFEFMPSSFYIITGGAIKLTRTMHEREHTLVELARMEKVRRFLINNDIADKDSFMDFLNEIL